jgi:hypothetical protein
MTSHVTFGLPDLHKPLKQIESDHESRKLAVLLDRLNRQIAARKDQGLALDSKRPSTPVSSESSVVRMPMQSVSSEK